GDSYLRQRIRFAWRDDRFVNCEGYGGIFPGCLDICDSQAHGLAQTGVAGKEVHINGSPYLAATGDLGSIELQSEDGLPHRGSPGGLAARYRQQRILSASGTASVHKSVEQDRA